MIKIYCKREHEKKLAKIFRSKDDFKNQIKAIFYILEMKKYFNEHNYKNIKILVNSEYLQNIANASI